MSSDVADLDRKKYLEGQKRTLTRQRKERLALTEGKGNLLEHLYPSLYDDNLTYMQVTDYLGITRGTLTALVRIHGEELEEAGYKPAPQAAGARFSRRSILHLAMLLRPTNATTQAARIKKAMGLPVAEIHKPARDQKKNNRWATHVATCRAVLDKATETAESVQEVDPKEVWDSLSKMDRWQVQALVIALGALVPLDQEGLFGYLASVGDKVEVADRTDRADYGKKGHVARGLATLIPYTRAEYEASQL